MGIRRIYFQKGMLQTSTQIQVKVLAKQKIAFHARYQRNLLLCMTLKGQRCIAYGERKSRIFVHTRNFKARELVKNRLKMQKFTLTLNTGIVNRQSPRASKKRQ